jgi:tetratricopeptide (TPR) repeat protein
VTQEFKEFNISVTPIGGDEFLVRTELTPDSTAAEERVTWPVQEWLTQASLLMNDPLLGLLRGDTVPGHGAAPMRDGRGGMAPGSANLSEFGQTLYNALFQGTLRDSWMRARGIAQHRQAVLRLRLGLKDARLPCLPWEVLHAGDHPLATGLDVVFSRYHTHSTRLLPAPLIELDEPLRILMVLAAPSDQERLALQKEAQALKHELESSIDKRGGQIPDIKVEILDQPDRALLTQALEHRQYQVLHYAGHSNVGASGGSLYLVNRTTGLTETLSGDDLAGLLVNNGIRMAVFNSCRSVYTATASPTDAQGAGNLAEALVKRGIPAVLAMAEQIPDHVALDLSRIFYRNLRRAYPVDLSLNRARQGLVSSYGSNTLYWALPTLYMHPEFNGLLQPFASEVEETWAPGASWEAAGLAGRSDAGDVSRVGRNEGIQNEADLSTSATVATGYDPYDAFSYLDSDDDFAGMEAPELPDDAVAQMVQELSKDSGRWMDDRPVSVEGDPTDTLRPDEASMYAAARSGGHPRSVRTPVSTSPSMRTPGTHSPVTPQPAMQQRVGMASFSELEGMLADTNRLTAAIAACIQATRHEPSNAAAYHKLGQVLAEQGHQREAIVAYEQALQLNPNLAEAHHDLGGLLFQQGEWDRAVYAFSSALQLKPNFKAAQQQLNLAQLRQNGGNVGRKTGGSSEAMVSSQTKEWGTDPLPPWAEAPSKLTQGNRANPSHRAARKGFGFGKMGVWAGGVLGLATLVGAGWLAHGLLNRPQEVRVVQSPSAASTPPQDWSKVSTKEAAATATQLLNQGNVAEAQPVVEGLLDQGATQAAKAALTSVQNRNLDNPTFNFLMGRLAWKGYLTRDKTFKPVDARKYWAEAVKLQPAVPKYQMALGFAYYEEGNWARSQQAFLAAIKLETEQAGGAQVPSTTLLNTYAGLALVLVEMAKQEFPKQSPQQWVTTPKVREALKLSETVMIRNPTEFTPDALSQNNWVWSDKSIGDWRSLLSLPKPPS